MVVEPPALFNLAMAREYDGKNVQVKVENFGTRELETFTGMFKVLTGGSSLCGQNVVYHWYVREIVEL